MLGAVKHALHRLSQAGHWLLIGMCCLTPYNLYGVYTMAYNDFANNSGLAGSLLANTDTPSPIQDFVPEEYRQLFIDAANKHGISPRVMGAMAKKESSFNPNALGADTKWGKAKGMFQYLDSTARGKGIDAYDVTQSANAAAEDFATALEKYGNVEDAFKHHFAGPNQKGWGPKTRAYGKESMKLLGEGGGVNEMGNDAIAADPRLMALLFAEAL